MVKESPVSDVINAFDNNRGSVVYLKLSADWITPVQAFLQMRDAGSCFLFESVERATFRGRYSVIGCQSSNIWTYYGNNQGTWEKSDHLPAITGNGVTQMRQVLSSDNIQIPNDIPALAMGFYGFIGFDFIRDIENLPTNNPDTIGLPVAKLFRPSIVIVFDNVTDELLLVTAVLPTKNSTPEAEHAGGLAILHDVLNRLQSPAISAIEPEIDNTENAVKSNMTPEKFYAAVESAKEAIKAGDCFQIVLSQCFSRTFTGDTFSYYRKLRRLNPSPYLFFLQMGDFCLVGSSPETLVKVENGQMTVRPIAGTRPRGKDIAQDKAMENDLLADAKERSEHLMLLDLGRNDISRVCDAGTVRAVDSFTIERYSHVMHIVSTVQGKLRDDCDVVDALFAGFPAGTVSGAPKVKALQIIDNLEPTLRRHYGGGVGYFSADGITMDTCIALRTAVIYNNTLHVQAGAGIVADSDPQSEYTETVNKARALLVAAGS